MNRAVFLKLAAVLGISPTALIEKEDGEFITASLKVHAIVPGRFFPINEEVETTIEVTFPSDLNLSSWAEVGISEEHLHALAAKHFIHQKMMAARVAMRRHGMRGKEVQDYANDWRAKFFPIRGIK